MAASLQDGARCVRERRALVPPALTRARSGLAVLAFLTLSCPLYNKGDPVGFVMAWVRAFFLFLSDFPLFLPSPASPPLLSSPLRVSSPRLLSAPLPRRRAAAGRC